MTTPDPTSPTAPAARDKAIAMFLGWTLRPTVTPDGRRMDWQSWHDPNGNYWGAEAGGVPSWGEDADSMLVLIDGMEAKGFRCHIKSQQGHEKTCEFFWKVGEWWHGKTATADTLPRAVANAAAAAVESTEAK